MIDYMNLLQHNTLFWSRLGFYPDPVAGDGKCPVVFSDPDKQINYHRQMAQAGIKLHTSVLFSGWVGVDKIDYTLTDETLEAAMSVSDDIYYMPRIKLNVPIEWCREYPEEVFVYENGPTEAEEIRNLVGTGLHDTCGIMKNTGTGKAEKYHKIDSGKIIGMQSFASRKWLEDAGNVLKKIISHLENGPYADRIVGYHIAYGLCGETVLWGRPTAQVGDYSICARNAFLEWGIRKYGSVAGVEKAWNQPGIAPNHVTLPSKAQRQGATENFDDFFRRKQEDVICIDYDEFMTEINVNAMEHFARIVKENTHNKPTGFFYGYILGVFNPAYTGHLGIERVLNSEYIDFLTAPKAYYKKVVGESGGSFTPIQSVCRQKIWLDELDNQTHLINYDYSLCKDFNDSRSVMWREACKNISYGSNFWWMDLYGGAFDSDALLNEIAEIEKFKRVTQENAKSRSEVLVVTDEHSFYSTRTSFELQDMHWEILRQLGKSGTLIDIYRLSDLKDMKLDQYKFIVFLMPYRMDHRTCSEILNSFRRDAVIFWNYAPGAFDGFDNMQKLSGMTIRTSNIKVADGLILENIGLNTVGKRMDAFESFITDRSRIANLEQKGFSVYGRIPMFEIEDDGSVNILARYQNGSIAGAEKKHLGRKHIFFTISSLCAEHWAALMQDAGVFMYAPPNTVVYGNEAFLSVFNNQESRFKVNFPAKRSFTCLTTHERYREQDHIILDMPEHSFRVFVFEE